MKKIKLYKYRKKEQPAHPDRECFLYGICTPEQKSEKPESKKITEFGLEVMSRQKGENMKVENNIKIKQENACERLCSIYGVCSNDPLGELLKDLTVFGLEMVKNKKAS